MKLMDFSVQTLVIIANILLNLSSAESCSFKFNDRCFEVHTEKTTRSAAAEKCATGGGQLAVVENLQVWKLIRKKLVGIDKEILYWIGLVDHDGTLTWNYNNHSVHYPDWIERPLTFPCFQWNGQRIVNSDCNVLAGYICESASDKHSSRDGFCPRGSFPSTDSMKCFWRTSKSIPMFAKPGDMGVFEECALSGGVPLNVHEIHGKSIGNLVGSSLFIDSETDYWVDMYYDGTRLANSSSHGRDELVYKDTRRSSRLCFVMHVNKIGKRHLRSRSCLNFTYGICQADRDDVKSPIITHSISKRYLECPHGYNWKEDTSTGYCYWETSYETSRLTWSSARSYCQSYGGDLASFHSRNEELIGLSFQYGTLIHPYWIGLKYDEDSESYKWVDGSSVTYSNWAPGQPKNHNGRMACVQMHAAEKHWVASYCGSLSWFVCKAPKQISPKLPVLPTQQPLERCLSDSTGYRFNDYCYNVPQDVLAWESALSFCERKGANLVSIHSENETDFLIRMLYELRTESRNVWIGAHAGYGPEGIVYSWTDDTAMDFFNWEDDDAVKDYLVQTLICADMYVINGLWRQETSCYQSRHFICKQMDSLNSLSVGEDFSTTTPVGLSEEKHCKKEWLQFEDNCFLVKGMMKNEWKNWEEASDACRNESGHLVSINGEKEQEIVTFLLQYLKHDTHIGLYRNDDHRYVWSNNNTVMQYSHWDFERADRDDSLRKCVKVVYDAGSMGAWRTSSCAIKLPYICKTSTDPEIISTPEPPKFMRCLHPRDWTKIGSSCFKMFESELSRPDAEAYCNSQYSSNLVSVSDITVLALVKYLTVNINKNFWIGLSYNSDHEFQWINNYTMNFSNWDKNQPNLTEQCCSSSPLGHWALSSCTEKKPFICQVTGMPASNFTTKEEKNQNCPKGFIDTGGKYCYFLEKSTKHNWFDANIYCLSMGGNFASFHKLEEMKHLENVAENKSYFIGMIKNVVGGFSWTDQSPVDFVNWLEPDNNNNHRCVIMTRGKLEWKLVSCEAKHHFACGKLKASMKMNSARDSALIKKEFQAGLSGGAIAAVIIILLVSLTVVAGLMFYIRSGRRLHFGMFSKHQEGVTSFENALFDPDAGVALSQKRNDSDVDE